MIADKIFVYVLTLDIRLGSLCTKHWPKHLEIGNVMLKENKALQKTIQRTIRLANMLSFEDIGKMIKEVEQNAFNGYIEHLIGSLTRRGL